MQHLHHLERRGKGQGSEIPLRTLVAYECWSLTWSCNHITNPACTYLLDVLVGATHFAHGDAHRAGQGIPSQTLHFAGHGGTEQQRLPAAQQPGLQQTMGFTSVCLPAAPLCVAWGTD